MCRGFAFFIGASSTLAADPARRLIQGGAEFDAYAFLKQLVGADSERPFRTSGPQLTALQQVMARLKEEGNEGEPAYAVARAAFSKAFSMSFMVQAFMNTALSAPDDEDSRENVEW
ncbi:hypothetical protein [Pseudomonas sp. Pseu.R1]|uniref:hypothetical protein n=1 Tax=Pseudomonas sp. Pseu.R1 TaxID=3379818 RepID=UPI003B95146C